MPYLLWDYVGTIFGYWLNDESKDSAHTTRVVDGSMEIISLVLSTGLIGKGPDLISFLFWTHIGQHLKTI